jgi:hypothetical protein
MDLDASIRAAFAGGLTAAAISATITAVTAAEAEFEAAAKTARERALDPTLSDADISAARRAMEDAAFRRDRMSVAVTQLRERLVVVKADEEDARRLHLYEEAQTERDKLAKELREFYPSVAVRLAALLARIVANDEAIERINARALPRNRGRLLSAELTARDLDGWVLNSRPLASRLTENVRLPMFMQPPGGSTGQLWPPPQWRG